MSRKPCSWPRCPNATRRGSGRCHVHRYADRNTGHHEPSRQAVADTRRAGDALKGAVGVGTRIDVVTFVSGAYSLELRRGATDVGVQSFPPDEWRVWIGSEMSVLSSLEEVVALVRRRSAE